jgi:hypothetical protein
MYCASDASEVYATKSQLEVREGTLSPNLHDSIQGQVYGHVQVLT